MYDVLDVLMILNNLTYYRIHLNAHYAHNLPIKSHYEPWGRECLMLERFYFENDWWRIVACHQSLSLRSIQRLDLLFSRAMVCYVCLMWNHWLNFLKIKRDIYSLCPMKNRHWCSCVFASVCGCLCLQGLLAVVFLYFSMRL